MFGLGCEAEVTSSRSVYIRLPYPPLSFHLLLSMLYKAVSMYAPFQLEFHPLVLDLAHCRLLIRLTFFYGEQANFSEQSSISHLLASLALRLFIFQVALVQSLRSNSVSECFFIPVSTALAIRVQYTGHISPGIYLYLTSYPFSPTSCIALYISYPFGVRVTLVPSSSLRAKCAANLRPPTVQRIILSACASVFNLA